jgi:GT2 family glycosyltransferase
VVQQGETEWRSSRTLWASCVQGGIAGHHGVDEHVSAGVPVFIDVIVLSFAATAELRAMTERTLESLHNSEDSSKIQFNVLVIESNRSSQSYQYPGSRTIYPGVPFGYNRYLNIGLRETSAEFVCLANNDLTFHAGWATAILEVSESNPDILSFSPVDPWLHEKLGFSEMPPVVFGYEKMKHVTGWCFVIRRQLMEIIGEFDERLEFWYVDDDYSRTLESHRLRHALVRDSKVDHLSGETISELESKERARLTSAQWLYFDYKWNHRSRVLYALKRLVFAVRKSLIRSGIEPQS